MRDIKNVKRLKTSNIIIDSDDVPDEVITLQPEQ